MMKRLFFLLMVLVSFSLKAQYNKPIYFPAINYFFDFNVRTLFMKYEDEQKILNAVNILRSVFYSREFKNRILNHEFNGELAFHKNDGLSNEEIYTLIIEGAEKLHPFKNFTMDVEIELYTELESNVLGYTYPRSKRVWMNTKYFEKHSLSELAGHLTHEWLHKLGFDHERERTEDRKFSVPYAVGYITRELASKIENDFEESKKYLSRNKKIIYSRFNR